MTEKVKDNSATRSLLMYVLALFAIGGMGFGLIMLVVHMFVNLEDEIEQETIALIAEELDLKPSEIVMSDDEKTFYTEQGIYKADFNGKRTDRKLRSLIKISEDGDLKDGK